MMNYKNRSSQELTAQALLTNAAAEQVAKSHELGCITLCFTSEGAFRLNADPVNYTQAIGLLTRAAIELHLAMKRPPLTLVREPSEEE